MLIMNIPFSAAYCYAMQARIHWMRAHRINYREQLRTKQLEPIKMANIHYVVSKQ